MPLSTTSYHTVKPIPPSVIRSIVVILINGFVTYFARLSSPRISIPALQNVFKVVPLNVTQLFTVYGLALLNLPVIQLLKWIRKRR